MSGVRQLTETMLFSGLRPPGSNEAPRCQGPGPGQQSAPEEEVASLPDTPSPVLLAIGHGGLSWA